jgi:hypothetical protein
MRRTVLGLIAACFLANGIFMFGWPEAWYVAIDVAHTGPFNAHFVRDIGCAYAASAGGIFYFVWEPDRGRPAALVGISFLGLHGVVHLWDTLAGRSGLAHLTGDSVGVFALPFLAAILGLSIKRSESNHV